MKKIFALCSLLFALFRAESAAGAVPSIFSTSTDWEALTGLRLNEYRITFGRDATVSNIGMELYFLDGFPCYGQAETARAWVSPQRTFGWDNGRDAQMRITCLIAPEKLYFAYREARSETNQGRTKGMLICDVERQENFRLRVRLPDCVKGKEWNEFR